MIKLAKKKEQKLINLLVTEEEERKLKELAELYTRGNMSAWIRFASKHYRPKKNQLDGDGISEI